MQKEKKREWFCFTSICRNRISTFICKLSNTIEINPYIKNI